MAFLLCALQASAAVLPEAFTAEFKVSAGSVALGRTRWSLSPQAGGGYLFESVSSAKGFWSLLFSGQRTERSFWRRGDRGLRPLRYEYIRTGRKARTARVTFDWNAGVARNTHKGETWEVPVEPGTLDKLLYLLAVMEDLAQGREHLSYRIADGGKLKTYDLALLGRETLDTPLGKLEAIKVRRKDTGKRQTTVWCAPALRYLPVKVEHVESDGDVVSMLIESVHGL